MSVYMRLQTPKDGVEENRRKQCLGQVENQMRHTIRGLQRHRGLPELVDMEMFGDIFGRFVTHGHLMEQRHPAHHPLGGGGGGLPWWPSDTVPGPPHFFLPLPPFLGLGFSVPANRLAAVRDVTFSSSANRKASASYAVGTRCRSSM